MATVNISVKDRVKLAEQLELSKHFMNDFVADLSDHQVQFMLDNRIGLSNDYVSAFGDFFDDFIRKYVPDLEA